MGWVGRLGRLGKLGGVGIWGLLFLLAGCGTKTCRCYLLEKWGNVVVSKTYVDDHTDCSDLGYDEPNPQDSSFRYCQEIWEPEVADTQDIVRMFWGH